jgi:hypothetical protein
VPEDDGEAGVPPEGEWPQEPGRVDTPKYGEPPEPDPHELGPPIPEAPDPTETDAEIDPGTYRLFWGLVVVFNLSLLALSLGVMFAAFEGRFEFGAQLFLAGAILFAYGYVRYRKFEREKDDSGAGGDDPDEANEDPDEARDGVEEASDDVDDADDDTEAAD